MSQVNGTSAIRIRHVHGAIGAYFAHRKKRCDGGAHASGSDNRIQRIENRKAGYRSWASDSNSQLIAIRTGPLIAEVDCAVTLIHGNWSSGVAANSGRHRWLVCQTTVVGPVDVKMRRRLQSLKLPISEIHHVSAIELHPVAIILSNSRKI